MVLIPNFMRRFIFLTPISDATVSYSSCRCEEQVKNAIFCTFSFVRVTRVEGQGTGLDSTQEIAYFILAVLQHPLVATTGGTFGELFKRPLR